MRVPPSTGAADGNTSMRWGAARVSNVSALSAALRLLSGAVGGAPVTGSWMSWKVTGTRCAPGARPGATHATWRRLTAAAATHVDPTRHPAA